MSTPLTSVQISTSLAFRARPTIDAVYQQCLSFTSGARLQNVDDVIAFGRTARNGPGYWDANALCAIAAINARPRHGAQVQVSGMIEQMPFHVAGDSATVRRILTTYVPMAVAHETTIDDYTVNGQAFHNGPAYWSGQEVAQMIASQVPY